MDRIKALIVDESVGNRNIIRMELSRAGVIYIDDAKDGEQALDMLLSHYYNTFNLVIINENIAITGMQLLKKIRANPATENLFCVVTSPKFTREKSVQIIDAGASGYSILPFDISMFKTQLMASLDFR